MRYVIFTFNQNGRQRVEAYSDWGNFEPSFPFLYVFAPSRNQARKWAYRLWIRADGQGFNKFPLH